LHLHEESKQISDFNLGVESELFCRSPRNQQHTLHNNNLPALLNLTEQDIPGFMKKAVSEMNNRQAKEGIQGKQQKPVNACYSRQTLSARAPPTPKEEAPVSKAAQARNMKKRITKAKTWKTLKFRVPAVDGANGIDEDVMPFRDVGEGAGNIPVACKTDLKYA